MDETKKCPYCGETIQKVARKCKWCGEWLEEENTAPLITYITCPVCGEQIPEDSKVCPFCKESVVSETERKSSITVAPPQKIDPQKKRSIRPTHILIGIIALGVVVGGTILIKNHINNQEYQEKLDNSPYNIIRNNLEEAVAKGQTLTTFLNSDKNADALKEFFGDDTYNLMLKLSAYSDEPLIANDPKDNTSGGYAWKTPYDKGKTGIRLRLNDKALSSQFFYDGLEVDQFGYIKTNDNWHKEYYKDDFNEDDKSKPYIEQRFKVSEANDWYFIIRMDNFYGISIRLTDFRPFDKLVLRNNDTDEVWELPVQQIGSSDAVLKQEGFEKFLTWMQNASSLKLSAINSDGSYNPLTTLLRNDETRWRETFEQHVMKRQIDPSLFLNNDIK